MGTQSCGHVYKSKLRSRQTAVGDREHLILSQWPMLWPDEIA